MELHRLLSQIPLLEVLSEDEKEHACRAAVTKVFSAESCISDYLKDAPSLAILTEGRAAVQNKEGDTACLQILTPYAVFGVANLFSCDHQTVSTIVAQKSTTVCFLPFDVVETWVRENAAFALAYIRFLSERICFLNRRLTAFTAPSATDRLKHYLFGLCKGTLPMTVEINAARLSTMLNIGRASLYRAFDALEENGIIEKNGKSVTILKMGT